DVYKRQPYTYADFVLITRSSPLPQIQASTLTTCVGSPVTFSTPVGADGYEWLFPGGTPSSSSVQNPSPVTFATPGVYWVKLRLQTTCCGFSPWDSIAISVVGTPSVILPPDTFRCASDPPISLSVAALPGATIVWFYNGSSFATGTTSIQASSAGQYVVSVSYPGGCEGRDTFNLSVLPRIPVNLGPDRNLCAGDPPPVLDAGFPGNQYLWTYNGVAIATTQTLVASQTGSYAVVVSNSYGCVGRDTVQVTFNHFSVNLGPDIQLCATSATLDAGLNATSCQWSLNGSPLPGNACQITATASGTYTVTAQNAAGCVATDQIDVILGSPLTAQFSGPSLAQVGQVVQFTDLTTPPPTQWTWNFGDGTLPVSGIANPSHTYTQAGLYPVVLAASNGLCTDTALGYIDVQWDCSTLPLQASFSASPNPVDLNAGGGTVYFSNTSSGATSYTWFFGTGDSSQAVSPSYVYAQPGSYQVILVARNYNCLDTFAQTITVIRAEPSALLPASSRRLQLYPNPARGEVQIVLPFAPSPWRVELFEATGRIVRTWDLPGGRMHKVDLHEIAPGYYVVRASREGESPYWGHLLRE
ncbi:MAG: PKD domain-containing protein, partial [Bacteroidia bacterium]|nr:PKD domain-containing protein [Bacteroidia bacterium]